MKKKRKMKKKKNEKERKKTGKKTGCLLLLAAACFFLSGCRMRTTGMRPSADSLQDRRDIIQKPASRRLCERLGKVRVSGIEQRELFGLLLCPFIDDIPAEVEVLRHIHAVIRHEILVGIEFDTGKIAV